MFPIVRDQPPLLVSTFIHVGGGDLVHVLRHHSRVEILGGEPARIVTAAHLTYHMRPPLQWQDPAGHHGGKHVAAYEAPSLQAIEVDTDLRYLGRRPGVLGLPVLLCHRRLDGEGWHVDGVAGGAGILHIEEAPLPLLDGVLEWHLREAALRTLMHECHAARGHQTWAIELLHLGLVHFLGLLLEKE